MKTLLAGLFLLFSLASVATNIERECKSSVYIKDYNNLRFLNDMEKDSVASTAADIIRQKGFLLISDKSIADFKLEFIETGDHVIRAIDYLKEKVGHSRVFIDSYVLKPEWSNLKTGSKLELDAVSYGDLTGDNLLLSNILNKVPDCTSVTPKTIRIESLVHVNPLEIIYEFYVDGSEIPNVDVSINANGVIINQYNEYGEYISKSFNYSPARKNLDYNALLIGRKSDLSINRKNSEKCIRLSKSVEAGVILFKSTQTDSISFCQDKLTKKSGTMNRFFSMPIKTQAPSHKYDLESLDFVKKMFGLIDEVTSGPVGVPKVLGN